MTLTLTSLGVLADEPATSVSESATTESASQPTTSQPASEPASQPTTSQPASSPTSQPTSQPMAALPNSVCPVTGEPALSNFSTEHQGQQVHFCCAGCIATFRADPEQYLASLPQFGGAEAESQEGEEGHDEGHEHGEHHD